MPIHISQSIILAYVPDDEQFAQKIYADLIWWGFDVLTDKDIFLEEEDLVVNDDDEFDELSQDEDPLIKKYLENCDVIVVVYSDKISESQNISKLLSGAFHIKKPIIPVLRGQSEVEGILSKVWKSDFSNNKKTHLQHMRELAGATRYPPELSVADTTIISDADKSKSTVESSKFSSKTIPIVTIPKDIVEKISIFISHINNDKFVNRLVLDLEHLGYITWVDHLAELTSIKTKEEAMQKCDCMIFVVSQNTKNLSRSGQDWNRFYDLKKPIIPIRLQDTSVPLLLRMHEKIDFDDENYNVKLEKLLEFLAHVAEYKQSEASSIRSSDGQTRPLTSDSAYQIEQFLKDKKVHLSKTSRLDLDPIIGFSQILLFFPNQHKAKLVDFTKPLIIGRQHGTASPPDIDLTPFNPTEHGISRQHAKLESIDDKVFITDLNSTNGTFIRRTKLNADSPTKLRNKEMISLGGLPLQIFFKAKNPIGNILYDIFLSYSREDRVVMRNVVHTLQTAGFSIWVDEDGLQPGTASWRREVAQAIDASGCVVAIFSPDAKISEWVEKEIDYAETQGKTIFSIFASGDRRTSVPFGYTLNQWVDIREEYDDPMSELIVAIRKHLELN